MSFTAELKWIFLAEEHYNHHLALCSSKSPSLYTFFSKGKKNVFCCLLYKQPTLWLSLWNSFTCLSINSSYVTAIAITVVNGLWHKCWSTVIKIKIWKARLQALKRNNVCNWLFIDVRTSVSNAVKHLQRKYNSCELLVGSSTDELQIHVAITIFSACEKCVYNLAHQVISSAILCILTQK